MINFSGGLEAWESGRRALWRAQQTSKGTPKNRADSAEEFTVLLHNQHRKTQDTIKISEEQRARVLSNKASDSDTRCQRQMKTSTMSKGTKMKCGRKNNSLHCLKRPCIFQFIHCFVKYSQAPGLHNFLSPWEHDILQRQWNKENKWKPRAERVFTLQWR